MSERTFTVQQVLGQYGQDAYGNTVYGVQLTEHPVPVRWVRKKGAPVVGEVTPLGHIGETDDGPRFFRARDQQPQQQSYAQPQQQAGPAPIAPQPQQQDRTHAIQRQHSQSVAIEYLKAKVHAGAIGGADKFPSLEDVRKVIDWFEHDIARSVNGQPATPPAQPIPGTPFVNPDQSAAQRWPQQTGQSDVPEPGPQEFVHPQPAAADKIPF